MWTYLFRALPFCVVAFPVSAAEPMGELPTLDPVAVGVAVAVALLAVLTGWHRWRLSALASNLAQAEERAARLEDVLLAGPDGFYFWEHGTAPEGRCSRRLAVLLGLYGGTDSTFDDVLVSFSPAEAAGLKAAVERLRDEGESFETDMVVGEGRRRVLVLGQRVETAAADPIADLVWFKDVTDRIIAVDRLEHVTEDLVAERDRLKALLDALPLPVWLRDDDLSVIYCNRAYAGAVDAPSPEAAINSHAELASGTELRQSRALAARARAAGEARSESFTLVLGGQRQLTELLEAPVTDHGSGLLTAGCAFDLTEREELETDIGRHVTAHAEVLERLATPIAIFGPDMRLAFFNTAYLRLWRLERDWLLQQPTYSGLLDTLRDRRRLPETADWRAFKEDELRRFTSLIDPVEDVLYLPDETTLRRVTAPHPFGGLLFTYEDVTDNLALERSYNTSLAVQRETLDHLHEGVAVFGADGRLKLSNPSYRSMWHLDDEDGLAEPHIAELAESQSAGFPTTAAAQAFRDHIQALFQERIARRGRVERGDGSILDYASVPLPDGALLLTWLDVSDSARVERALRERSLALAEADRLKSEFIANVSAELRAPLTTIIGYADILTGEYYGRLNKRQHDYAAGIGQSGQRLESLVGDILDLAAIEAGQITLQLSVFDVHALLSNVLSLLRERAREKLITLNFDCPLDIGWMVGDERRLRQVLYNVMVNAVKFTPAKGQVSLACQRDHQDMVFTIADTGMGIAEAQQTDMFDSFQRGSQPEGESQGAGLGLTLVRRFVELHGGRVEMVSVPGEGTTITCRLPAEAPVLAETGVTPP